MPTGTIAEAVGWTDSATAVEGAAAETIAEALTAVEGAAPGWHGTNHDTSVATEDEIVAFANWIKTRRYVGHVDLYDASGEALVTNESSSISAVLSATGIPRVFGMWSRFQEPKGSSYAGAFGGIDWQGEDTLITGKFVQLPNMTPDVITLDEKRELDRKRLNYYAQYGPQRFVAEGVSLAPNQWADLRYFIDWAHDGLQNTILTLLAQRPRVAMDPDGFAEVENVITNFLNIGVRNGSIATGLRTSDIVRSDIRSKTNNPNFDGTLPNGYLVSISALSSLTQAQRNIRQMPAIRVWIIGSDAIHFANVVGQLVQGQSSR